MVFGALPAAKLGVLFVKQFTKSAATGITRTATKHPIIIEKMCIPMAQLYNQMEVRWRLRSLKFLKKENIPPLNKTAAAKLGTHLLSECILFLFGAVMLTMELMRQAKNEAEKKRLAEQKEQELLDRITVLEKKADEVSNKEDKGKTPCRSKIF